MKPVQDFVKKTCQNCGTKFTHGINGRPRKYCSLTCRRLFDLNTQKNLRRERKTINCAQCKKLFLIGVFNIKQKYCSELCRKSFYLGPITETLICKFCEKVFTRERIKGQKPTACMICRTSGLARRFDGYRKHKDFVIKRDNGQCQICFTAVNLKADYNNKFAPTLDHIVPRSFNGSHEPENLRLAHRWCNSVRQNNYMPHGRIQLDRMVC